MEHENELENKMELTFPNGMKVAITYPFWMRAIALHSVPGLAEVVSKAETITLNGKNVPKVQ